MNTAVNQNSVRRIALGLEYDGSSFSGFQKQSSPALPTVQGCLETAISRVADTPISTTCAGRTDAGVHATGQVIHFDTPVDRGNKAWTEGVNSLMPDSVRVLWAQSVNDDFHARFSATARRYHYVILQRDTASALLAGKVTHWRGDLDVAAMNEAAQMLLGEQDFSSFRAAGCQSKTPNRNVHHARVVRQGAYIVLDIEANAFLQHMVRNIAGTLLDIGQGKYSTGWMRELLAKADRTQASMTASGDGLYLTSVTYPASFALPVQLNLPPLLLGGSGYERIG